MSKRQTNKILEDHGDWLLIDISTPKHPDSTMKIDKSDWSSICGALGRVSLGSQGYAQARDPKAGSTVRIHMLMFEEDGLQCDHTNRDRTDNRRKNLRRVTHSGNMRNVPLRSDNKSGCRGVGMDKSRGKWAAYLGGGRARIYLGRFERFEDAKSARIRAEDGWL
jgi:hypothetical protein